MGLRKITYPRSLQEIPLWRRRQITQDLLWFSKFSPAQRLQCIDREWDEIQAFISKFGLKKYGIRPCRVDQATYLRPPKRGLRVGGSGSTIP